MKGRKSIGEARATLSVSVLPKLSSEEALDKHNRLSNTSIDIVVKTALSGQIRGEKPLGSNEKFVLQR